MFSLVTYVLQQDAKRQAVGNQQWDLITTGNYVADKNLFRRGGIQYFPLYLYYSDDSQTILFDNDQSINKHGRKPQYALRKSSLRNFHG